MYGTISRMRIKPGREQDFMKSAESARDVPGIVFEYVYKLDGTENEYMLAVGFESREAYVNNANSPEQHERYLAYRELMESDPQWNDGEVVYSYTT